MSWTNGICFVQFPAGVIYLISSPERTDRLWNPFGALSLGIKPSVCESDDFSPSSAKVTNGCHFRSLINLNGVHRDKFTS
jgi:hypothetical protein